MNRVVIDVDKPFSIFVCVRRSCDKMFILISIFSTFIWFVFQYSSWDIIIITSVTDRLIWECIIDLNAIGSNEEKISGIITKYRWYYLFRTLKILSLY